MSFYYGNTIHLLFSLRSFRKHRKSSSTLKVQLKSVAKIYFKNHTERECAQRLGMSQQAIHERKKRILKKIKNNLDEEGC